MSEKKRKERPETLVLPSRPFSVVALKFQNTWIVTCSPRALHRFPGFSCTDHWTGGAVRPWTVLPREEN